MVFYRKYRPQKIEELDSEEIRTKLNSVLSGKDLPHAFLFTGPKGLGKTSTARIVAKAVNCEKNQEVRIKNQEKKSPNGGSKHNSKFILHNSGEIEPCNKCSQCTSITNGTNLDILEIDGASNRGIDEIRDLREKIRLLPVSASKKVYIIDEVHMLTTEAFNALLKTLEEPPRHVIFILCTTEFQKIPATILSRCFHINFKLAVKDELLRSFKRIAKDEKLAIDDEALDFLASLSDGSFRDGVKILEELSLLSAGEKITKELIEAKYHVSSIKYQTEEMIGYFVQKDVKGGLNLVSEIVEQGMDIKYFIQEMINVLHQELLEKAGVQRTEDGGRRQEFRGQKTEDGKEGLELNVEGIKKLIELLSKAYGEVKFSVLPQLPLEMAIIEWGIQAQSSQAQKNAEPNAEQHGNTPTPTPSPDGRGSQGGSSADDQILKTIIDLVKVRNQSIAGVLRGCSLKKNDGKKIIIEAGYKFHKEKLEEKKAREVLEDVIKEINGSEVEMEIVLRSR